MWSDVAAGGADDRGDVGERLLHLADEVVGLEDLVGVPADLAADVEPAARRARRWRSPSGPSTRRAEWSRSWGVPSAFRVLRSSRAASLGPGPGPAVRLGDPDEGRGRTGAQLAVAGGRRRRAELERPSRTGAQGEVEPVAEARRGVEVGVSCCAVGTPMPSVGRGSRRSGSRGGSSNHSSTVAFSISK